MRNFRIGGVILLVLEALFFWFWYWAACIPITLNFMGATFMLLLVILTMGWTLCFTFSDVYDEISDGDLFVPALIVTVVLILGFGAKWVSCWDMFNAEKYQAQLGTPVKAEYTKDFELFDANQIPIVDPDWAPSLCKKTLGQITALGSQVEIGEFTTQNVNGKLVLVAPLEHSGFWKYKASPGGTPGYVMVSARNPEDVKLVTDIDGKKIPIKYQPCAFFDEDLERHIRTHGFMKAGLTDYSFELDDQGYPYYCVTEYENQIGWGGQEAIGIIVVNATTGEIKHYSIDKAPAWIDRIQPMWIFDNQSYNYGEYVHGYWNWSDKDKITPTSGTAIVFSKGRCYFFTGMTSAGNDDSTVGFLMCDTRTKKTFFYKMSGAHEQAAQQTAEGAVQDFEYTAAFPLPVNVNGEPSYFMTLKDNGGVVKMYAFVNIKDYRLVGVGKQIEEAKLAYMNALSETGNKATFEKVSYKYQYQGKVKRIGLKIVGGESYYYLIIEGVDNKIFTASAGLSPEIPITAVGDTVDVKYNDGKNNTASIESFDNLMFEQEKVQ
ncbi:MAG: cell shape-determining protein [Ignavibacteriales bacterium]